MKYCFLALWLLVANSFGEDAYPRILADNIHVHLVGARVVRHPTLGPTEHLFAKFQGDDERSRKLLREFSAQGPITNAATGDYIVEFSSEPRSAHEATIINVISSCISLKKRDPEQDHKWPPEEWDPVKFDLFLSVSLPVDGEVVDYGRWLILSFRERKENSSYQQGVPIDARQK